MESERKIKNYGTLLSEQNEIMYEEITVGENLQ